MDLHLARELFEAKLPEYQQKPSTEVHEQLIDFYIHELLIPLKQFDKAMQYIETEDLLSTSFKLVLYPSEKIINFVEIEAS